MKALTQAKDAVEDRARRTRDTLRANAEYQFILKVQKWEGCTYQEAVDLCSGTSPERNAEYILGFRLSDPLMLQAMFLQIRRSDREKATERFRETLDDDVRDLFDRNREDLKRQYLTANRKKGR